MSSLGILSFSIPQPELPELPELPTIAKMMTTIPPLDYITKVTLTAWCNADSEEDEPVCECGHTMRSHCLDDECCNFSYELGEIAGYCFCRCGCAVFIPSKQWLIQHETMSHRPYCADQFGYTFMHICSVCEDRFVLDRNEDENTIVCYDCYNLSHLAVSLLTAIIS